MFSAIFQQKTPKDIKSIAIKGKTLFNLKFKMNPLGRKDQIDYWVKCFLLEESGPLLYRQVYFPCEYSRNL